MTFLEELTSLLQLTLLPIGFGVFPEHAPDVFIVFYPMDDKGRVFADDADYIEVHEARIGLYARNTDYEPYKNRIKLLLRRQEFNITQSRYVDFENSTGYHHYNIDVAKYY